VEAQRTPSAPQTAAVPSTPTAAPESVDAPAPGSARDDAEEIIKEACTTGLAVVESASSEFYSAANPSSERRLLTTYPKGTSVTLLGSCYIGWVKVQPNDSVTPGWMFAPDLKLIEEMRTEGMTAAPASNDSSPMISASPSSTNGPTPAPQAAKVLVVRLPVQAPPVPGAVQRQTLTITVRVADQEQQAISGVKVLLVNAFGQQLIDAVTPADGQIVFTPDLPPHTAVSVQLPTIGITVLVDPADPFLTITLPRGKS
jgi:hypothetical protein